MSPTRSGHRLEIRHTADLTPPMLDALATLMDAAFDHWTPNDTDHTFGGLHAMVVEDVLLLAHGSLVQRTLLLGDRPSRVGYVEGVAVHPDHRHQGLGSAVMRAVEQVAERAYPLAALSTSDEARGFYEARGWVRWEGPTSVMAPSGMVRTPDDDGGVYVRSAIPVDVAAPIACDWRAGDVW